MTRPFTLRDRTGFSPLRHSTAIVVLATRNTKDFAPLGVSLFNPWTDGGQSR